MTGNNDFLTLAGGGSANVLSQSAYLALTSVLANGYPSGILTSVLLNKTLRQTTAISNLIGAFIAAQGQNANDDGNATNLLTAFDAALTAFVSNIAGSSPLQSISASVASNALTLNYAGGGLSFRNATLTTGAPVNVAVPANSLVIPSGATLGTTNGVASQIILLEAYNGGTPVLCAVNAAGSVNLDETTLISPTNISTGATSASTIYSAATVSANSPFRVIGYVNMPGQTTAGTWATGPTLVQGEGGQALTALQSIGNGQTWQNLSGSRALSTSYYNTTSRPIFVNVYLTTSGAAGNLTFNINGNQAGESSNSIGNGESVFMIVPPGASYSAQLAAGTLNAFFWSELR